MTTKEEILERRRPITRGHYYIYALIHKEEIVYVGQSSSLLVRIANHYNSKKVFDSWAIVESLGSFVSSEEFTDIERSYISKLKPKYNKHLIEPKKLERLFY
tara:strand:- start:36 stop:341 length:306 start_codon:yes stop_codon:yes gene_type:complete